MAGAPPSRASPHPPAADCTWHVGAISDARFWRHDSRSPRWATARSSGRHALTRGSLHNIHCSGVLLQSCVAAGCLSCSMLLSALSESPVRYSSCSQFPISDLGKFANFWCLWQFRRTCPRAPGRCGGQRRSRPGSALASRPPRHAPRPPGTTRCTHRPCGHGRLLHIIWYGYRVMTSHAASLHAVSTACSWGLPLQPRRSRSRIRSLCEHRCR